MKETVELWNSIDFRANVFKFPETELDKLPQTEGIAFDMHNSAAGGEQAYAISRLDNTHIHFQIHISDPTYAVYHMPEIVDIAIKNKSSTYIDRTVVGMLPGSLINNHRFQLTKRLPAVTIEAQIDTKTGLWSDLDIYQSACTITDVVHAAQVEPLLEFDKTAATFHNIPFGLYFETAMHIARRYYGQENFDNMIELIESGDSKKYCPYSDFIISTYSSFASELFAAHTKQHSIPVIYTNLIYKSMGYEHIKLPDWATLDHDFEDIHPLRYDGQQISARARCTTPWRDVRSLVNLLNVTHALREGKPRMSAEKLQDIAKEFSLEKRGREQSPEEAREKQRKFILDEAKKRFDSYHTREDYWTKYFFVLSELPNDKKQKLLHLLNENTFHFSQGLAMKILEKYTTKNNLTSRVHVSFSTDEKIWIASLVMISAEDEVVIAQYKDIQREFLEIDLYEMAAKQILCNLLS